MLKQLHPEDLKGVNLAHFQPYLEELVDTLDGEMNEEQILEAIRNRTVTLCGWYNNGVLGCYLIFELEELRNKEKALVVSGVIGETFGDYEEFHQACELIAKQHGCTKLKARGRRGIWRKYKPLGYKEQYTVYSYDVA